jgi:hypothetical protein
MEITYIEEEREPKGLQWRRLQLRANKCSTESREVNEESNTLPPLGDAMRRAAALATHRRPEGVR